MGFGVELCWPPVDLFKDFWYSVGLLFKPKHKLINIEDLEKIRELEKKAYPDGQHGYKNVKSIRDLKRVFACYNRRQIEYYLDEDCYFIYVFHYNLIYVADVVSLKNPQKTLKLIFEIIKKYKDKNLYMYARDKTGYKLLKAYEKKGTIRILEDLVEEDEKNNEEFYHMMKIRIIS